MRNPDHMLNEDRPPRLVTEPLPPLRGAPGIAQGAYGDAGNLELVVPDPDSGFWCFWWNADPVDTRTAAAVGAWSGGLHVAGERLVGVRVTQVQAGPRFLEVVAVGGDQLLRWFWTPTDGFVRTGTIATSVLSTSALVEDDEGRLHLLVVRLDGSVTHLSARPEGYPRVTWLGATADELPGAASVDLVRAPDGSLLGLVVGADGRAHCIRRREAWRDEPGPPGEWTALSLVAGETVLAVGVDGSGDLQVSTHGPDGWTWPVPMGRLDRLQHVTAAATSLDGGRVDIVAERGGQLWHITAPTTSSVGAVWACEQIASKVWCTGDVDTVHRR
ncbi:hypothetical protein acdb102_30810 [Acidothermaceae bacterium B102]|nr:hypothetical protein acdb102_30810 [Acidothermaceae bacterium B102]